MRGPNQTGIPLAPDPQREPARSSQPGVAPRFDPYVPTQGGGQNRTPPQGSTQNPYGAQRPATNATPPRGQQSAPLQMPPVNERRYAGPAQQMPPERPPVQGRQGQPTGQPPRQASQAYPAEPRGYAPPAQGYDLPGGTKGQTRGTPDGVPQGARGREPFFEAPAARRAPARPAYGYAQDGYGQDPYAESAGDHTVDDEMDGDDADDGYEEAPARRGRSGRLIAGSLAVAVILGSGLGYAYKVSLNHGGINGNPPVLQADKAPAKTVPADGGGQTADAGKKTILERAASDGSGDGATMVQSQEKVAVDSAGQSDAVAVPRKVATVVVKPGQSIGAVPAANDQQEMQDSVPGVSLSSADLAPKPAKGADLATAKAKTKAAAKAVEADATQQANDAAQVVADAAAQDVATASDGAAAAVADVGQQPAKLAGAALKGGKKVAKTVAAAPAAVEAAVDGTDATTADQADPAAQPVAQTKTKLASAANTATAPAKSAGGGYVIQVRSTKTQAESLAFFADLQQRYGNLLGSGQPDIQEVDLGTKGRWYRLRIGPPGSGGAAKDLCSKLKSGGLKDCIVAAY